MVLCFSMRSCGILQLVSYRLKKYIYFLSKISAWKGGFYFFFFFSSPMGMVPSVVHIAPCLSALLFILCVGEKRRVDSVRPCTVWTVSVSVCVMVCFFVVRQFYLVFVYSLFNDADSNVRLHSVEGPIICELGMICEEAVVTWLEGFFCRDLRNSTRGL